MTGSISFLPGIKGFADMSPEDRQQMEVWAAEDRLKELIDKADKLCRSLYGYSLKAHLDVVSKDYRQLLADEGVDIL